MSSLIKLIRGGILQSKLPQKLQEIIKNEPHKLVIFINPPYAESPSGNTSAGTGRNKIGVSNTTKIHEKYRKDWGGDALKELFMQFFVRIYAEIPNCILGSFSKLKHINASKSIKFREKFKAKFLKGFIVPSNTFNNVKENYPIGFLVWNLGDKQKIEKCRVDIFDKNNRQIGKKNFYANLPHINQWITTFNGKTQKSENIIGWIGTGAPDFQNQTYICLLSQKGTRNVPYIAINKYNLMQSCIYFAVRHAIKASWIKDRDQFLYPNDKWQKDTEFRNDCLIFTLFHNQNFIKAKEGINHFIPFSEEEVNARQIFQSHFMVDFIKGKIKPKNDKRENLICVENFIPTKSLEFSKEAQEVFSAGLALWKYYHAKCDEQNYNANASFKDIKEYFKGLNNKDKEFNALTTHLTQKLNALALKIQPKIYKYGFLKD